MDEATTYLLLPDEREGKATFSVLNARMDALRKEDAFIIGFAPTWQGTQYPAPYTAMTKGVDPREVVAIVDGIDWDHPPFLGFRSANQAGWHYLRTARVSL